MGGAWAAGGRARAQLRLLSSSPLPPPAATSPVPLGPGEVLLSVGGESTRRTVMHGWLGAAVIDGYVLLVRAIEATTPGVALLSPAWNLAFTGIVIAATALAVASSRCSARVVILAAGGHHIRVYPYGSWGGWGVGAPVTLPIKLLAEGGAGGKDKDALYVRIRVGGLPNGTLSRVPLVIDKPVALPRARLAPGSGLLFTPSGLAPESLSIAGDALGVAATAPSSPLPVGGAHPLVPVDTETFRRYVLLAWVVQGHPVLQMQRLLSGHWELRSMATQLGGVETSGSAAARAASAAGAQAIHWRRATDERGRQYFYNELSWHTQWHAPIGWVEVVKQ